MESARTVLVGYVDGEIERAHSLAAVIEIVQVYGSVAGNFFLVPAEPQIGIDIAFNRRRER